MSITINVTVTDEQLACLSHDLIGFPHDQSKMIAELSRRLNWVISHKVAQCAKRAVEKQSHILGNSRPVNLMEAAVIITTHPDFKTRDTREREDEKTQKEYRERKAKEMAALTKGDA